MLEKGNAWCSEFRTSEYSRCALPSTAFNVTAPNRRQLLASNNHHIGTGHSYAWPSFCHSPSWLWQAGNPALDRHGRTRLAIRPIFEAMELIVALRCSEISGRRPVASLAQEKRI